MLFGCDFSSAPTHANRSCGHRGDGWRRQRRTDWLQRFATLEAWGEWLRDTPSWVGGFDFPFSLPRELVEHLKWPLEWGR
jgi:hypothetical protein